MQEHRTGEGGAANTPPFPRPPGPAASSPPRETGGDSGGFQSSAPDGPAFPDAADRLDIDDPRARDPDVEADAAAGDFSAGDPDALADARDRAGGPDRAFDLDDEEPLAPRTSSEVRRRALSGLHRGLDRFADRLDEAADRLGRIADDPTLNEGPRARAGEFAHSASTWMEEAADYLRTADLRQMKLDFERQVREYPVQSLLLAAGTGWLLGKIMR